MYRSGDDRLGWFLVSATTSLSTIVLLGVINIGIKHVFSCINICQLPWEVLKTEAEGTWRMLMHWKPMFDRDYCIKSENICYISRYFLHYFVSLFTNV